MNNKRKQITQTEKMELLGLMTLGRQQYKLIDQVYDALTKKLGDDVTHLHDAVYSIDDQLNIDDLLEKEGIEVIADSEAKNE